MLDRIFWYLFIATGFIAGGITYDSIEYASTGEWLSPFHATVACLSSMWFLFTTIMFINRSGKEEGYDPWSCKLQKDREE